MHRSYKLCIVIKPTGFVMFFDLTGLYWERMFLFVRCNSPKLIKIDVLSQNVISNFKDDQSKTLFSNKIIKIARYVGGNNYTYQVLVNIDL